MQAEETGASACVSRARHHVAVECRFLGSSSEREGRVGISHGIDSSS
jgi:hypothetical protein